MGDGFLSLGGGGANGIVRLFQMGQLDAPTFENEQIG